MSELIHSTEIKKIGANATDFLEENMCIFFHEEVPPYLADFCYLIDHGEGGYEISVGDTLLIDDASCPITAIGEVALENFRQLGHLTVKFDGADVASQPGVMHVSHDGVPPLNVGAQIRFVKG